MPQSSVENATQTSCPTPLTLRSDSSSNTRGLVTTQKQIKSARKDAKAQRTRKAKLFFAVPLRLCAFA